jgi:dTDP-4-dehydrorhamnose reductase
MLGQDVVLAADAAGHDVLALWHADVDISDVQAVERVVSAQAPAAVINCAAWTDVDGAEEHEAAAEAVNGDGAGQVARAAAAASAKVVHVSTDYVFDGRAHEPYLESAATGPLSAYGRSKLAGERAVAEAGGRHLIVRSSWLFGVAGKNFVETMLVLGGDRDEVAVVTDQIGCPTWTGHLAPTLVALAAGEAEGIMHVAGSGACSWYELASETFRRAEVDCEVRETTTAAMQRPAPRPAYSVLESERTDAPRLPGWQDGLAGYLAAITATPA